MALAHHRRVQLLALSAALPSLLLAAVFPWLPRAAFLRAALLAAALAGLLWALRRMGDQVQKPLQTLSNLLGALREGDFSFRAREPLGEDALGQVYLEVNVLSGLLQDQRLKALEATALLRAVMTELDVAVFAFDESGCLRLVNRAGEQLLDQPQARLLGLDASALGLSPALEAEAPGFLDMALPGRTGRFEARRIAFRQGGRPMQLLVLSDLTRSLREEERVVWQRLIRVLGHEINNSLAPIQSLSQSLVSILERKEEQWLEDARQGLGIIESRTRGLGRFMEAYTRLAKLPPPRPAAMALSPLAGRVAALETRVPVSVVPGPDLSMAADEDQLAQALINLVRNAAEASLETGGAVTLTWRVRQAWIEVEVADEGAGLPAGGNLFVPFFTTKPGGNGIGLLLARQIAEGHGGSLSLEDRKDRSGARALLRLPLEGASSGG